jgi:hypothetical protein
MPVIIPGSDCVLAEPIHVATQGLLDNPIGMATLGWVIQTVDTPPVVVIPVPPNNIGSLVGDPRREWWVRRDDTEPWHGPLSYRDANYQARRMTMDVDETISELKYAQVGTILGTRGGDPLVSPDMFVAYLYANGKQYLGGRMAEFNADKVPVAP